MSALDERPEAVPAPTRPSRRLERALGRPQVTALSAAMVSGLTFVAGLAGVAIIRFNALAWRGSQVISAAVLLAVAAGGVWYWRKVHVWLDVLKDLHS